ncbi:unnamed protein product, partial [Staurois parvus]
MTRDCGHSTGDDQRLQTVQEMTRDCGSLGREGSGCAGCPLHMRKKR